MGRLQIPKSGRCLSLTLRSAELVGQPGVLHSSSTSGSGTRAETSIGRASNIATATTTWEVVSMLNSCNAE